MANDATRKPGWNITLPMGKGDGSANVRMPWDRLNITQEQWYAKSEDERRAQVRAWKQKTT